MIELLLESWIRTAILAAGIASLLAAFRVEDAAMRHKAWKLVLAAMILMPFVVWTLPGLELPILSTGTPVSSGSADPAMLMSTSPPTPPGPGLEVLYALIGLVLLIRMGIGYLFAIRLVRSGVAVDCARFHRVLPGVRYLATACVNVPMTLGWLRPVVLLPIGFDAWSGTKLRAVLDHEHAHVERRDFLTGVMASIACAVHWLNPMAWWLEWRLRSLAEHAADDVAAGRDRQTYASLLVELAEAGVPGRLQSVPMARMPGLSKRIQRLSNRRSLAMSGFRNTTFAIVAFLLFAAASLVSVTRAAPIEPVLALVEQEPEVPESESETEPAAEDEPEVFRIGAGVTPPTVISHVDPGYTEAAREAQYEGVVVLEGIVRTDGTMEVNRVLRGLGFGLDEAAVEALEQWEFEPGMRNGEPVNVAIRVEVNFNMRDEPNQPE